ncbi:MAG: hypothetical protein ACR2QJ_10140, partial [Geminicoccaceae bacterium]
MGSFIAAILMLAVFYLDSTDEARAAVFVMENGETIEGQVIDATRHAIIVRRDIGGVQQARYADIREIRLAEQSGELIVGKLQDWSDGTYWIDVDGHQIRILDGAIQEVLPETAEEIEEP